MWFIFFGVIVFSLGFSFLRAGATEFQKRILNFSKWKPIWRFFGNSNDVFIGIVFSLIGVFIIYGGFGLMELRVL